MAQTLLPPTKVSKRAARTVKMVSATADRSKNLSITTGGKISAQSVENLSIISAKLIDVDNFLRDSLVLDKVKAGIAQKKAEQDLRDKQEDDAEKDTPGKLKLPGQKFFGKVNNWITKLIFGWLAIKLIDFLPALMKWLPVIGKAVDWIIKWAGKILNGLVTFIDWGYDVANKTKEWIKDKFGPEGEKKFTDFMGNSTSGLIGLMNGIFILGMTTAAFADALGGINPLELLENLKNKKWVKKGIQRGRILGKKATRFVARRSRSVVRTGTRIVQGVAQSKVGQQIGGVLERGKRRAGDIIQGGRQIVQDRLAKTTEAIGGRWNKFKNRLGGMADNFKKGAADAWEGLSTAARKKWDEWAEIAARQKAKSKSLWSKFKSKIDEGLEWAGKGLKGLGEKAQAQLMEKLITPFRKLIAPVGKWADDTLKPIWKAISGSPAFKWIKEALAKKGVSSLAGKGLGEIAQKVGAKAIPVIGGFVNLWFAKDRWGMGDKFGAGIEGLAGILDIASAIAPPLGIPALVLDGYMLVRDLVPQVKETEDNILKKFGSTFEGVKSKAMEFSNKLAGVSEMFMGGDKKGDEDDTGSTANLTSGTGGGEKEDNTSDVIGGGSFNKGSGNLVVSKDNSGLSEKVHSVSSSASYEDEEPEVVFVQLPAKVIPVSGGSEESSSSTSSSGDNSSAYEELYIR